MDLFMLWILISLSFEMAAKIGFKNAAKKAKSVLLEPIMKLEVVTPDDYLGDVTGDLNKRRAICRKCNCESRIPGS